MTVVFFSRLFYPHIGGVEKHALEIGKILLKNNHKVVVFTEQYHPKLKSFETIEGIDIYRLSVGKNDWFKKFRIWREIWKNRDLIKKTDVIHVHDVFFWYLPFRFFYLKKPVFTTFHGYETKFPPSKRAILIRKISERLAWGNICVGEYIKKWYGTNSDHVTYGGIDVHLGGAESLMPSSPSEVLKILFIGRMEEDTGVPIYLKTLDILKEKKINFEFEACGDGSLRGNAGKYGKVFGFVEDLAGHINKADIIFASSYLSMMQAMINKRLVFAVYNNPLKEDYIKMAPFAKWIIINKSAEQLADKIQYFIQYWYKKNRIVDKAYEWVKSQTWKNIVSTYLNLWHKKVSPCEAR